MNKKLEEYIKTSKENGLDLNQTLSNCPKCSENLTIEEFKKLYDSVEGDLISEKDNCSVIDFEYVMDFSKLDCNELNKDRIIYGEASNGLIDNDDQIVDLDSLHKAFDGYMRNPVIRFMHGRNGNYPGAIGKVIPEYTANDGTVYRTEFNEKPRLVCKISNSKDVDDIWIKIEEGILKGLSVGGKIERIEKEIDPEFGKIERVIVKRWAETSIVDLPCNTGAFFNVIKACIPKETKEIKKEEEKKSMTENKEVEKEVEKEEKGSVLEIKLDDLSKIVEENVLLKLQEAETAQVATTKADVEGMVKKFFEDMGKKFDELKAEVETQAAMLSSGKISEEFMHSEKMGELVKTVEELKESPLYKGHSSEEDELEKKGKEEEITKEEEDDGDLLFKILSNRGGENE